MRYVDINLKYVDIHPFPNVPFHVGKSGKLYEKL